MSELPFEKGPAYKEDVFIGIDPGTGGAIAVINKDLSVLEWIKNDRTEHDMAEFFYNLVDNYNIRNSAIEKVHSSPQMGVASAFTFGRSYGFLRGILTYSGIRITETSPQGWMKLLGIVPLGKTASQTQKKNMLKGKAQMMFAADVKRITLTNCDALLLARFAQLTV